MEKLPNRQIGGDNNREGAENARIGARDARRGRQKTNRTALFGAIILVFGLLMTAFLTGCGRDEPPEPAVGGDEVGTYYLIGGKSCELTLKSDLSFLLDYSGTKESGRYLLEGEVLTLDFDAEGMDNITASYRDRAVTLPYGGATLRLIRKINYTLSFNTGGAAAMPSVSVLNGQTVARPEDPTRTGYIFVGWYKDAEFSSPYSFSSEIISGDTTVYARWVADTGAGEYDISFALGYDGEPIPSRRTLGGRLFDLPEPKRAGYSFRGWWVSTESDPDRLSYRWDEELVFTKNTVLHALWREDGSALIDPPSLLIDGERLLWDGVSGARSYSVTMTDDNGVTVVSSTVSTTSVELGFGSLAAGVYTVELTANAVSGARNNSTSYYRYVSRGLDPVESLFVSGGATVVWGEVENAERYLITVVCGNSAHRHTELDVGLSRTFSFAGCRMSEGGIRFRVKAVAEGYLSSVSEELIYKRELSAVSGLTYNQDVGTVGWDAVEGAEYYSVELECDSRTETVLSVTPFVDLRAYPADALISVKVTPVADGYISPVLSLLEVRKTALPTPAGLTLSGDRLVFGAVTGASGYEITVNGTAYTLDSPVFELSRLGQIGRGARYEVRVRALGTAPSPLSDTLVLYGYEMGSVYYKDGYVSFDPVIGADGYELQVGDGEILSLDGTSAPVDFTRSGDNTVRVRCINGGTRSEWVTVSVRVYAITLDTLGGGVDKPILYIAEGDIIPLPRAARQGYSFISWYDTPGGPLVNGRELDSARYTVTGDAVLYAHYDPVKYGITFNYGGGTGLGVSGVVEYERDYIFEVPVAADPTHSFGGWFSSPYGRGTQYTDGEGRSLVPWCELGGREVYAFWIDETLEYSLVKVNGRDSYSVSAGPRLALVSEVTVPESYNGLRVAMIDGAAFADCRGLVKINIPASIEVISTIDPFAGCLSLKEINIYEVKGTSAPRYRSSDGVLFENKSGETVLIRMPVGRSGAYTLPEWVSEIGEGAFAHSSVESVVITPSVKKIGNDAFGHCASLRAVTFGVSGGDDPSLTVGKRAFGYCTALSAITLPARLLSIELSKYSTGDGGEYRQSFDQAFVGCSSLVSVGVAAGSASYSSYNGFICSQDKRQIIYCPESITGSVSIPAGVASVGAGAFIGCDRITEIYIPSTVTYIGEYSFRGLSLNKVTLGGKGFSSVTVGDGAFADCALLRSVVIEAGAQLSVIGAYAFSGCLSLTEFTVTQSVTLIRSNAFDGCTGLGQVTFEGGKRSLQFGTQVFRGCTALTTVKIPANVTEIPGIFGGCTSLTEVLVDEGNESFVSLGGVVFSKDMTSIVYYPEGKGGVYEVPEGVKVIGAGVFSGNTSLSELIIPNTVEVIGKEAFAKTKIGRISFKGDRYSEGLIIEEAAFRGAYLDFGDTPFALPAHTKEIGDYAFAEVYYKNITLNEGLRVIGAYAFYMPSNDNGGTLVIPASVESVGEYCFSGETVDYSVVKINRFVGVSFAQGEPRLTSIGDYAFYKNPKLTALTLPDTVRVIGNYAFYECLNLSSVTLSSALEEIGAYAFAASANTYKVPISSLIIPEGVTAIGARAFENCQLLTTVRFEGKATSGDLYLGTPYRRKYTSDGVEMFSVERGHAFASCTRLSVVELSPNLTTLGDYSFLSAGDIGFRVTVPEDSRLTTIGAYCFYKSRLVSFTVPSTVRNLAPTEELGITVNRMGIGDYAFAATAGKLTELVFLSDGSAYPLTIGRGAFENQSQLTSVQLPARLSTYSYATEVIPPLADGALVFFGARSLSSLTVESGGYYKTVGGVLYTADLRELVFCPTSLTGDITLPDTVEKIHAYAFSSCSGLKSLKISGNRLGSIGAYAFFGCSSLSELVLPSSVGVIGECAFVNMTGLVNITLPGALRSFDISTLDGCSSLESVSVGAGSGALVSEGGVLYSLDKTVLLLYPAGRKGDEYRVADGTVSIGKGAFCANKNLKTVILPNSLDEICSGAFSGCSALESLTLPSSVGLIGEGALADTAGLGELVFIKGGTKKLVIDDRAFYRSGIGAAELPARVAAIGAEAFSESALSSLSFETAGSYTLTEIGARAFYKTALVKIELPDGVRAVGEGAFASTESLESAKLGQGLLSLGDGAFKDSSLKTVSLPRELEYLGARAFYGCERLLSVDFGSGCQLRSISAAAFYGCSSLKRIEIPAFVKELEGGGEGAFENCAALSEVVFLGDDSLTLIGDRAFSGCSSLLSFEIPMSVGTLGSYAFAGCSSLSAIALERATVTLGVGLFEGCTSLSSVTMNTGAAEIPDRMFYGCTALELINIPAGVTEIGVDAFRQSGIQRFDVAQENRYFVSVDGILYNSARTAILCLPPRFSSDTLFIPKEVAEISASNFEGYTNIKKVIFEEGGTTPLTIGSKAFAGCYQLRTLVLPDRLVSIGTYAFKECYGLTSVTLPKNLKSIGDYAFTWCYKLYEVRNESGIENVGSKGSIKTAQPNVNIYTPTEGASVLTREGDFLFALVKGVKTLIGYEGDGDTVTLPSGEYVIAEYLFYRDTAITRVIIPSVSGIAFSASSAFSGCTSLECIFLGAAEAPDSWADNWSSKARVVYGYTGEEIKYSFVTEGEAIEPVLSEGLIKLPVSLREGYLFMGWYDNAEYTGDALPEYYYSSEKTTLYARFLTEAEYIEEYLRGYSMEYAYGLSIGEHAVNIKDKGGRIYFALNASAGESLNISTPSGMGYHKIWIFDAEGNEILSYTSGTSYDPEHDINYTYSFKTDGKYYIAVGYSDAKRTGSFTVSFAKPED